MVWTYVKKPRDGNSITDKVLVALAEVERQVDLGYVDERALERLDKRIKLVRYRNELISQTRRPRLLFAAVLALGALVVVKLGFQPLSSAQFRFHGVATATQLRMGADGQVLPALTTEEARIVGLEHVSYADENGQPIERAKKDNAEFDVAILGAILFSPIVARKGATVSLASTADSSSLRATIDRGVNSFVITPQGKLTILTDESEKHSTAAERTAIECEAGSSTLEIAISMHPEHATTLWDKPTAVAAIAFREASESLIDNELQLERFSSLLEGTLEFPEVPSATRVIHRRDELVLGKEAAVKTNQQPIHVRSIRATKDGNLDIEVEGWLDAAYATLADGERIDFVPSVLEYLAARRRPALILSIGIYVLTLVLGVSKWFRVIA